MIRSIACARSPRKSGVSTSTVGGCFELSETLDALDETSRTAIREIVAIDGGDHDVLETHLDTASTSCRGSSGSRADGRPWAIEQ